MFKVGDQVRRKLRYRDFAGFSEGANVCSVSFVSEDGQSLSLTNVDEFWDADKFELVSPVEPTIDCLIPLIHQWGVDRGILENSTPIAQSRKTIEEVHEMITACAQLKSFMELVDGDIDHRFDAYEHDLKDAIGDVFVTLVMVAGCAKLDITKCVAAAYDEIKDRKGYLRPDGVFVKEEK